jgi:hypothetical protein
MDNLPKGVERIQVNVIKETVNQPTRELKLDENGIEDTLQKIALAKQEV